MFSSIIHANGEIETSQFVKLYSASIVLSGEIPDGMVIAISTFSAVLSSIFLIFILPLSLALRIDCINDVVVVEKGNSVIINVSLFS